MFVESRAGFNQEFVLDEKFFYTGHAVLGILIFFCSIFITDGCTTVSITITKMTRAIASLIKKPTIIALRHVSSVFLR